MQVAGVVPDVKEAPAEVRRDPAAEAGRVRSLDGIRAIAIIVVLLFHHYQFGSQPSTAWSGGFLGVDVFFVLSGFLITNLLLRDVRRSGTIDFARFWSRRARRLLPALFLVVALTALLARFAYDPLEAQHLRGEGIATLLYVENWYRISSPPSALSHTWSLSVEEQWYLLWPLLLAFLVTRTRDRPRLLTLAVTGLAIASAVECALLFHGNGERAYYGTDTRAQALLVGAVLAVALNASERVSSRTLHGIAWCALAFLAWMFAKAHATDAWMYRGGFLLVAVAAAVIIATVVRSQHGPLARVLASPPLVAIGVISYGLYLYHYPVYVWLDENRTHLSTNALFFLRVTVTGIIAVASYFLVERRFRRGPQLNARGATAFLLPIGVLAVALFLATPSGVPSPVARAAANLARAADSTPPGVRRVFVVGDSAAFRLGLRGTFDVGSIRGAAFGMYGCDVAPGDPVVAGKRYPAIGCETLVRRARQLTKVYNPAFGVLMVGAEDARDRAFGTQTLDASSPEMRDRIVARIDRLRQSLTVAGARFVLLPARCDVKIDDVSRERVDALNRVLADYAAAHPHDVIFDNSDVGGCIDPGNSAALWSRIALAIPPG